MEPFFNLNYYWAPISWDDYKKMPFSVVRWLIKRTEKEINKNGEKGEVSKGTHHNTGDIRELTGRTRQQVPRHMAGKRF